VPIETARQLAQERELDLVEVAPLASPPVCRLMDYGRYKFEQLKKDKESRREHNVITIKEMKLRPKISEHDFQTKFGSVRNFLREGDKVKLTIMFRGREMVHQEYGRKLLDRMADELKEMATIERNPLVEGRNMTMIMSPLAKKHSKPEQRTNHAKSDEAPPPAPEAVATDSETTETSTDAKDQNA
jgi:translation initiation factor IF-3